MCMLRRDTEMRDDINGDVDNDEEDTTGALWVEKYAPCKYTQLLSDEVSLATKNTSSLSINHLFISG